MLQKMTAFSLRINTISPSAHPPTRYTYYCSIFASFCHPTLHLADTSHFSARCGDVHALSSPTIVTKFHIATIHRHATISTTHPFPKIMSTTPP